MDKEDLNDALLVAGVFPERPITYCGPRAKQMEIILSCTVAWGFMFRCNQRWSAPGPRSDGQAETAARRRAASKTARGAVALPSALTDAQVG